MQSTSTPNFYTIKGLKVENKFANSTDGRDKTVAKKNML